MPSSKEGGIVASGRESENAEQIAFAVQSGYGISPRALSRHNPCCPASSAQHECAICYGLSDNRVLRPELFEQRSAESAELLQSANFAG